mmetsp:Transcript_111048/g.358498  ORF Transcript_111048/g.358498 Transcript_111048/m.358498 type:complete len:710 (+) Transcript_111048:241-2370(+)
MARADDRQPGGSGRLRRLGEVVLFESSEGRDHDVRARGVAPEDHAVQLGVQRRQLGDDLELASPGNGEGHHGISHWQPRRPGDEVGAVEAAVDTPDAVHVLVDLGKHRCRPFTRGRPHEHARVQLLHRADDFAWHVAVRHPDAELGLVVARDLAGVGKHPLKPGQRRTLGREVLRACEGPGEAEGRHHAGRRHGRRHGARRRHAEAGHHTWHQWHGARYPGGWHVRQGDVATVDQATFEDCVKVLVEVHGSDPEKALAGRLRVVLGVDQRVGHIDVLEATVKDAWRAAEHLHVESALPCDGTVHDVGVVRIQPHAVEFAVHLVRPADEESVALELIEVDEKPIHADIAGVEPTCDSAGEVRQRLLNAAAPGERLPAAAVLLGGLHRGAAAGVELGVGLLGERGPEDVGEELGPATDRHVRLVRALRRRAHRHVVVQLDAHPCAVLVEPRDIDGSPGVPAMEELLGELRTERHRLQRLDKVAVVDAALDDAAVVSPVRGELVEEVRCVGVVGKIHQPHPTAVAVLVGHMRGQGCLPELGCFRVVDAADVELLVVRGEGHHGVGRHGTPQPEVGELLGVVRPAALAADPGHVALVHCPADLGEVDLGELVLLQAVALRLEPALVVDLEPVVGVLSLGPELVELLVLRQLPLVQGHAIRAVAGLQLARALIAKLSEVACRVRVQVAGSVSPHGLFPRATQATFSIPSGLRQA